MNIGNKISDLRKEKGLSRDALGKLAGTSGAVIGRYEREEITPSIDVAKKMLYRLELLQKVSQKERDTILHVLDSLLQTAQFSTTQQKLM